LFFLFFSLFSFCLALTAMWSYPSRCLLPSARSLARLICVAVQRRHPHKRRDARTFSLLFLFSVSQLGEKSHVLIHAVRILGLKPTSWSTLSESDVSNPSPDPRSRNLMSRQIHVLVHAVRILHLKTHVLIHAVRTLCLNKSTSYSILSESLGLKLTCWSMLFRILGLKATS
jgi:hypothetical protein